MKNSLYIWAVIGAVCPGNRMSDGIAVQHGDRYICMMKVCTK